jgi:hypothetical protein
LWAVVLASTLASCDEPETLNYEPLRQLVEQGRIGRDSDRWIEMLNYAGAWEPTALIFGFEDDGVECAKAIQGLRAANPGREYRCVPAN